MRVTGFDHLVLVVDDVERSLAWYRDVLGLDGVRVDEWRAGTAPFPSVRVDPTTIVDFVARGDGVRPGGTGGAGANTDHLCLVVDDCDLDEVARSGRFDCIGAPTRRFGAQGDGTSLYVTDPDGNVVELRTYP